MVEAAVDGLVEVRLDELRVRKAQRHGVDETGRDSEVQELDGEEEHVGVVAAGEGAGTVRHCEVVYGLGLEGGGGGWGGSEELFLRLGGWYEGFGHRQVGDEQVDSPMQQYKQHILKQLPVSKHPLPRLPHHPHNHP